MLCKHDFQQLALCSTNHNSLKYFHTSRMIFNVFKMCVWEGKERGGERSNIMMLLESISEYQFKFQAFHFQTSSLHPGK